VGDETDFVAGPQLVEAAIHDAVPVHIDFFAGRGQQEAVITLGEKPGDTGGFLGLVLFDLTAKPANIIFELAAGGVEGIPDRDPDILMRMMLGGIALNHDLAARNAEMDSDMEKSSLSLSMAAAFNHDLAGDDPIEELLEFRRAVRDQLPHGLR
jgi:hypothetical protein